MQSHYIRKEWVQPRLETANNPEVKELLIVIDSSNTEYFFLNLGINVLNAVKRVDKKEIDMEQPKMKIKIDG
ncbi:hypothetical protein RclHR1_05330007 [Rhizophagus clarus]|nr:hypothetical protein RclHR1_05330007 [Rhizophagus clarus]